VAKALEKAADDNAATITLKQVEATQRERDTRKAVEAKVADLEAEATRRDKANADFVCPAAVPLPAIITEGTPPAPPAAHCDLSDGDLDWLRSRFPSGRIGRAKTAHPSGRSH
jgi:hypothetical protein